jgi:putative ABC transport system permease protein
LSGLLQRPSRALLTMLGTILGIGSFVALNGISATASGQISDEFTLLEATEVTVRQHPPSEHPAQPFPQNATTRLGGIAGVKHGGVWWRVGGEALLVQSGLRQEDAVRLPVFAADPGALAAAEAAFAAGSAFGEFAQANAAHVALLSPGAASQLRVDDEAIGATLFVAGERFIIGGIVTSVERLPQLLTGVIVPTSTAELLFPLPGVEAPATAIVATEAGAATVVADQVAIALRPDNPTLLASSAPPPPTQLEGAVSVQVQQLVLALSLVALVIGAVGIANTTLVSIMERTPEIGLRRALGAKTSHIASQFLIEATILGTAGGVIGACLAVVAVLALSLTRHWTPLVDPWIVLGAPLGGILVGLLSGTYPAYRSTRIEPIAACAA